MKTQYSDESEIKGLLAAFESATIPREEWKHAHHLVVALCYVEARDFETATDRMRSGILNLLANGFGLDLKKEMPYHETLTVFWMRTVRDYASRHKDNSLVEKANGLIDAFDKDHPFAFYSREFLMSDEARATYLEPDLKS